MILLLQMEEGMFCMEVAVMIMYMEVKIVI